MSIVTQNNKENHSPPLIAIAGASGFVGTSLRISLSSKYRWLGLTRSSLIASEEKDHDNTIWRQCDIYSLPQLEEAMRGARYAVYLVHSMLPSTRLFQGSFYDLDLMLADNFIRAAEGAGIEHIIYLGGLIPKNLKNLSEHLASRLEVESVLKRSHVPVTVLRAGVIFGPGGSSAQMLINLVRRLPIMVLPKWTRSTTQAIDIRDVVKAIDCSLEKKDLWGGTYDLGGHRPKTYRKMILETAAFLNRRLRHVNVPFNSFLISRFWVAWISGTSPQLVNPLLDSLRHNLQAADNPVMDEIRKTAYTLEDSLRYSIDSEGLVLPNPRSKTQQRNNEIIKRARRVRSIQRLPLPIGLRARDIFEEYGNWLERRLSFFLQLRKEKNGVLHLQSRFPNLLLLELTPTPFSISGEKRRAFYITGGILSRKVDPPGRLEFRIFPERDCFIVVIHRYAPRLPWWLYQFTQAPFHKLIMTLFTSYLERWVEEGRPPGDDYTI